MFAWEWLRRREDYREAARRSLLPASSAGEPFSVLDEQPGAARWALHRFEDPERAAPRARPVWRADAHRLVLRASADCDCDPLDAFRLKRLGNLATVVRAGSGAEHLLLSDGSRSLRLDVEGGSLLQGPVRLRYHLAGIETAEAPLLVLRRLLGLWRSGTFPNALYPPEARRERLVLILRAHDGIASGATQREIAAELLDREARSGRWRIAAPEVRSRVQRLVRAARKMAGGGYLSLL